MKRIILAALAALLAVQAGAGNMRTAFHGGEYPRLMDDNTVVFKLDAPGAKEVSLVLPILGSFPMAKAEDGQWTVRSPKLATGFHYYWFNIDGAEVNDPRTNVYHGYGRVASAVEIPVPDSQWMEVQDVPHGRVCEVPYWSKKTGKWRLLSVYTPAEYDRKPHKRYPVVYIGHGTGENNRSWMEQGRTGTIIDNLIAEGKAVPMIIVSMDSQIYDKVAEYTHEGMLPYEEEFLGSIMPFVDSAFRTKPDAKHRAMCGLSQGSGESFYIGLTRPELFANIGMFSCGIFGKLFRADADFDKEVPGLLSNAEAFNRKFDCIYFSCGRDDYRTADYERLTTMLRDAGLEFKYTLFEGAHEWQPWRESIHEFAQYLFK